MPFSSSGIISYYCGEGSTECLEDSGKKWELESEGKNLEQQENHEQEQGRRIKQILE